MNRGSLKGMLIKKITKVFDEGVNFLRKKKYFPKKYISKKKQRAQKMCCLQIVHKLF